MAIQDAMRQIASIEAGINGVKQAFDEPPSSINNLPCFVNFVGPASIDYAPSQRLMNCTAKMQIYVTGKIVPESEKLLRPFIDRTLDEFDQYISLNDTCDYSMITGWNPGVMEYNGNDYLGIEFDITFRLSEVRSFAK